LKAEDAPAPTQGNGRPKRAAPKKTAEKPPPKKKARRTYDEDDEDEDDEESIDDYDDPNDEDFDEDDEEWELDCEVCGKKGRNPVRRFSFCCSLVSFLTPLAEGWPCRRLLREVQ